MRLLAIIIWIQAMVVYGDKVIIGYYTEWAQWTLPPSRIPFNKLTHINYAFAMFDEPGCNPTVTYPDILQQVVTLAHQNGVKVLISIGGWTGSKYFSSMTASYNARQTFVNNVANMINRFQLDGVDIDWEFPGQQGNDGNTLDRENDTNNYLKLLNEIRWKIGSKLITAAVSTTLFSGPHGPIGDARAFAEVFDWVNIMAYDINGAWSPTTGPLAGLDYEAGRGAQQSVASATAQWLRANFPPHKIVIGVPFYGYSVKATQDMTYSDQYSPIQPNSGDTLTYSSLFENGILLSTYAANTNNGWIRRFDPITKTPWLFNKNTYQFISYDDPQSLDLKTQYVKCNNLRGLMIWAINQDYQLQLLNSLQAIYGPCDPSQPTTTTPTTTKTTVPTTTTTTTTGVDPGPTGTCKDGSYKCGDSSSRVYYQCVYGHWQQRDCPESTICIPNDSVIYCGYPAKFLPSNPFKSFKVQHQLE